MVEASGRAVRSGHCPSPGSRLDTRRHPFGAPVGRHPDTGVASGRKSFRPNRPGAVSRRKHRRSQTRRAARRRPPSVCGRHRHGIGGDRGVPDRNQRNTKHGPGAGNDSVHRHQRVHQTGGGSGDRHWRELLDNHDRMAGRQVHRFGGRQVKTTGDGILATFDGPARAIQCGLAICDGAHQLGIEVRVGVHTGEVERRGDDIGGIGVHIAARVQAHAQPGEVSVSRTVTDLVTGSGITFQDRGEHPLKGVPEAWRLFSVEV